MAWKYLWILAILTNRLGSRSSLNFNRLLGKGKIPTNPVGQEGLLFYRFMFFRYGGERMGMGRRDEKKCNMDILRRIRIKDVRKTEKRLFSVGKRQYRLGIYVCVCVLYKGGISELNFRQNSFFGFYSTKV